MTDQARTPYVVTAECPLCPWRSAEVSLRDEPNAEWHARSEAAKQYRGHFDQHRPLPRFVRASRPAEANPDGTSQPGPTVSRKRGTDPRAHVGPGSAPS